MDERKNFGKYEILEELGRGGFGTVYKAQDKVLGRLVAIKVLHPALVVEPSFIERFRQEARIAASLDHPNLVPVHDFSEAEGRYYIAMGFMKGGSLKDLLKKDGPIRKAHSLEIIQQLGAGLSYAHSRNVIHRDLKPGNILFDERGIARVSDMGFAKLLHSENSTSMSSSGGLVGTPAYMAPEIWRGKGANAATDVYSLACILVEMLTAEPLFDGESTPEVMFKHFEPLQLPGDLPQYWKPVIEGALEKKPEDRIASVAEFITYLQRAEQKPTPATTHPKQDRHQDYIPPGQTARSGRDRRESPSDFTRSQTSAPATTHTRQDRHQDYIPPGQTASISRDTRESPSGFTRSQTSARKPATGDWREKIGSLRNKLPVYIGVALLIAWVIIPILLLRGLSAKPQPTVEREPTSITHPILSPIATPGIGSTMIREQDGMEMVFVPEGKFEMGSNDGDSDEKPVRQVYLDAYWIDKYEVSNRQYALCVAAGACSEPSQTRSSTRNSYYGNPDYDDYPVIYVSWYDASDYCEWVGGAEVELPTEAQWEKAARGTDGRTYPWGNQSPDNSLVNYNGNVGDTTKVGSYSAGASPYGVLDMAGNVWEWVRDNYGSYQANELRNPTRITNDGTKVIRGGCWYYDYGDIRAAYRVISYPSGASYGVGFRCSSPP